MKRDLLGGARRNVWTIVGLWLVIGIVTLPFTTKLQDATTSSATAFLPSSAESTRTVEAQKVFASADDLELTVVYRRDDGWLNDDDNERLNALQSTISSLYELPVSDVPIVRSADLSAVLINVEIPNVTTDDEQVQIVDQIRALLVDYPDGVQAKVTGPGAFTADAEKAYDGIDVKLLSITMAVVALLLLLTYRSPVLWVLPLLAVLFGNGVVSFIAWSLAETGVITLDGQTAGILPVLVFGVGTDYALLLVSRYRDALRVEESPAEAMRTALRLAAPTMVATAATVSLGLLCLLASDLNSNKALAPVGALSVVLTLVAALTLLPAMLVLAGRRVFWPLIPAVGSVAKPSRLWSWIGAVVQRRPIPIVAVVSALLVLGAFGALSFNGTLRPVDQFTNEPDSVTGQALVQQSFADGSSDPLFVVTNTRQSLAVRQALTSVSGISSVSESDRTDPGPNPDCVPDNNDASVCVDQNGKTEYLLTLAAEPGTPDERNTVAAVRDAVHGVTDANALVGGSSAEYYDVQDAAAHDRKVVIPLVLVVVLLVLFALLRTVLTSVVLVATVVLSFLFSLGVSVLAFRHLFAFPAEDSGLVLLGFVFLVALGVDYSVFLAARIREEQATHTGGDAVRTALVATGGVITSAGLVLAATFAVLTVIPVVSVVQVGFLVAFGILVDALIVRTLLVPALLTLVHRRRR